MGCRGGYLWGAGLGEACRVMRGDQAGDVVAGGLMVHLTRLSIRGDQAGDVKAGGLMVRMTRRS